MTCTCKMRDGAHEISCDEIDEYYMVHCEACDKPVWMSTMSFGLCTKCQTEKGVWKNFMNTELKL